jgi:DNA-binding transcriptional MerR regulator
MEDYILIPAIDFCLGHHVELETIQIINKQGLIEIIELENTLFIPEHQVKRLEQILVFNRDLDINLEGIETILELLHRMEFMQEQIIQLENKLQRFS